MSAIKKIKPIPSVKSSDGQLIYQRVQASDYGRIRESGNVEAFLLNESIRFYNYGLGTHGVLKKNPREWPAIDAKSIEVAIEALSTTFTESIVDSLDSLVPNSPSNKESLQRLKNHLCLDAVQDDLSNSAYQGLYAVLLFLSYPWRNRNQLLKLWNTKDGPKHVKFREFDCLVRRLQESREKAAKQAIELSLGRHYTVNNDQTKEFLFEPHWGGSWTVPSKLYPNQLFGPHRSSQVGPTEKLYYAYCLDVFAAAHRPNPKNRKTSEALKDIATALNDVRNILPYWELKTSKDPVRVWLLWLYNLNDLEDRFVRAVQTGARIRSEENPAVRLGLPVALGLIGTLRTFLIDLMARTLTVSLPLAIDPIYQNVNGYSAVAIWEALSNKPVRNANELESLLSRHNWGLVGRLKEWRSMPIEDPWGNDVPENAAARKVFAEIMTRPLRHWSVIRKGDKFIELPEIGFEQFSESLPRFPAITPAFYKASGFKTKSPLDFKRAGGRFFAQLHLYLATLILRKGLDALELKPEEIKNDKEKRKLLRRHLENFHVGAGSYLWGGKKPPHDTHRDGGRFDLSFGPKLPRWPLMSFASQIKKLDKSEEGKKFLDKKVPLFKLKRRDIYKQPLAICHTYKKGEQKLAPGYARLVFRKIISRLITHEFVNIYVKYDKTLAGEEVGIAETKLHNLIREEEEVYKDLEEALQGTPHFVHTNVVSQLRSAFDSCEITNSADWQRTHIGHLSILLSAPMNIVYASPIAHLRAIHAVRRTFRSSFETGSVVSATTETVTLDETALEIDEHYSGMQIEVNSKKGMQQKRFITLFEGATRTAIVDKPWDHIPQSGDSYRILDVPCYKKATEIARCTFFSFLPHNHHHHWHVDYVRPFNRRTCDRYWNMEAIERLTYYRSVWLSMGIDLSPFLEYLQGYSIVNANDPCIQNLLEEYDAVKEFCTKYQEEYLARFGTADQPKDASIEREQQLIQSLFYHFQADAPLNAPTVMLKHVQGKFFSSNKKGKIVKDAHRHSNALYERLLDELVALKIKGLLKEAQEILIKLKDGLNRSLAEDEVESEFGRDESD